MSMTLKDWLTEGIEGRDAHWIIIQIYRLIFFTWIDTARLLYILIARIIISTILIIPGMRLVIRLLGVEDGLCLLKLGDWLYE